jgi:hypothetical protein
MEGGGTFVEGDAEDVVSPSAVVDGLALPATIRPLSLAVTYR